LEGKYLLDVSTLPSGYYVLQVNSDKLVKVASFIKL
jgi:hypothetical protein